MPSPSKAQAAWKALNERQQAYLLAFYRADQHTEEWAKGAWSRGEESRPASEWRWMEYGIVGNPLAGNRFLQDRLTAEKLLDQGAGATIKVLETAGLVETRRESGAVLDSYRMELKMTPAGRAAVRAGGLDLSRSGTRRKGMLSRARWSMLAEVWAAGEDGMGRWNLADAWWTMARVPEPLVRIESVSGGLYQYRVHLTPAGQAHYRELHDAYTRAYPDVDADHPDGEPVWPEQVDTALTALQEDCYRLLQAVVAAKADMDKTARLAVPAHDPVRLEGVDKPRADRAAARVGKAAQACGKSVSTALDRYRAALDAYAGELMELYRQAALRYAVAANRVAAAVAERTDPLEALEAGTPPAWPWAPAPVITGAEESDARLEQLHIMVCGKPMKRGKPKKQPAPYVGAGSGLDEDADRLYEYASQIARLARGGMLARLVRRGR